MGGSWKVSARQAIKETVPTISVISLEGAEVDVG